MLPNHPSEPLPNCLSERFRTCFRTVPRTDPYINIFRARLFEATALELEGMNLKTSEVISELQDLLDEHGDLEVRIRKGAIGSASVLSVDGRLDDPRDPPYVLLERVD